MGTKTWKLEDNRLINFIDELDSLKQSIKLRLYTIKNRYIIYSEKYGIDYKNLLGNSDNYVIGEIISQIKKTLKEDDRITSISNFNYYSEKVGQLIINFKVNSIYGSFDYQTENNNVYSNL